MSNPRKFEYTYLDKRTHDAVLYSYTFVALAVSIIALYSFFPSILAESAGAMVTAVFVVLVSLCVLILVLPMLKLKKKLGWFIRRGSAAVDADGVTFTPGVRIAFSDVFRVSCVNAADFGNRFEALRIGYGTKTFRVYGVDPREAGEDTTLVQLARAIGEACPQLECADEDGDILYRKPIVEDPDAIHFRKN